MQTAAVHALRNRTQIKTAVPRWCFHFKNTSLSTAKQRGNWSRSAHLEIGRHESVVHHEKNTFMLMHYACAGLDVNDLQRGVGGRLDPNQLQGCNKRKQPVREVTTLVTIRAGKA